MKRIVSLLTIAGFALSPIGDSFAQTRTAERGIVQKVENNREARGTEFDAIRATSNGAGVLIEWQMKSEKGNMGFRIFRIGKGNRVQANTDLIFGSAAKAGTFPLNGEQYSFLDREGTLGSVYEIEATDLDGNRIISSTVSTSFSKVGGRKTKRGDEDNTVKSATGILSSADLELPPDVISTIGPQVIESDPDVHRWVVSHAGVRIGVKTEGIYRVTNPQLQAAGFDTASDPTYWQLYLNGVQQAITVGPGYIEFYGNGIDTIESDIRGYFLVVGDTPGKRIQNVNVRPSSGTVLLPSYDQTFTFKERINYLNSIFNGPDENYFGTLITSSVATKNITLSGIDYSDTASTIELKIQGFSNTLHNVELTLNGQPLNNMSGVAQFPFLGTQSIPTSLLRDASLGHGPNVLTLKTNDDNDFNLFDTVKIQFNRKHAAAQNTLRAYTVNSKVTKLTGFSSANTRIFDVSKSDDPKLMTNIPFQQQGGNYGATIPAGRAMSFYAVENSAILSPFSITPNDGELLGVETHGADLIIIAYKDFMTQAQAWANYRSAQGFSVKVVNVDEIFNEFNSGVLSSDSIESFLNYAYNNWRTAADAPPRYVLLVGDASFDSRNYNGTGFFNFVPTRIISTIFTETGSDESLADFNNDGLAEMAVGRIPARTSTAVTQALSKVTNWEANLLSNPLGRGALFAFDVPDGYGFQQLSEGLRDLLPPTVNSTMIARGLTTPGQEFTLDPNAQTNLLNAMNTGKYIVNYSGHGATGTWAATSFFFNGNVPSLTNHNNESLFTMLTCLNGYFLSQSNTSLAETLLAANNGGAVAAWSSTGLTTPDVQEVMARRFFEKIGQGTIPRLGDLITDAKFAIGGGTDVRLSWALLGDPMLKVR